VVGKPGISIKGSHRRGGKGARGGRNQGRLILNGPIRKKGRENKTGEGDKENIGSSQWETATLAMIRAHHWLAHV